MTIPEIRPRDFRAPAAVLKADLATMLKEHPEAFDCLIFPAVPGQEETVAVASDPAAALDADERSQRYAPPELGRARIIPDEGLGFEVLDGEAAASFLGASAPLNLLLSRPVAPYSLVQWLEYPSPEAEEAEPFTVYVLDARPASGTAGAGVVYVCAPLPALGEIPAGAAPPDVSNATPEADGSDPVGVI